MKQKLWLTLITSLALTHLLLGDKDAAFGEYEAVKTLKGEEIAKTLFAIIRRH